MAAPPGPEPHLAGSDLVAHVARGDLVLTDGGIETRFAFGGGVAMDPTLGSASLLDAAGGRQALAQLYGGYLDDAGTRGLAAIVGTPTFRASRRWVAQAGLDGDRDAERLNREAVALLREVRGDRRRAWVAGVLGPAGDAYRPGEALGADDAATYHRAQASWLADAGADLLFAATFPAVDEAVGVTRAMAATGLPSVTSFVLDQRGRLLDGRSLGEAVAAVDEATAGAPAWYSLSCVHPLVAARALAAAGPAVAGRVREVKANASALPPDELVRLDHVDRGDPAAWAAAMAVLRARFGTPVLGGCCGTDDEHLRLLARDLTSDGAAP